MTGLDLSSRDRQALVGIVRRRSRHTKADVDQRKRVLLTEVEDLLTAEHEARDEIRAEAVVIAEEAAAKANEQIAAVSAGLGIPAEHAPQLELTYRTLAFDVEDPYRQAELRKRAEKHVDALTATAKVEIDRYALDVEEALIVGGLDIDQARELVESLPTPEQLIPVPSLDDLGVKHWQPLTPSRPADRRRPRILRAIAANSQASNRESARLANCDRSEAGELPAAGRGIPTEPEGGEDDRT